MRLDDMGKISSGEIIVGPTVWSAEPSGAVRLQCRCGDRCGKMGSKRKTESQM